ncbi:MAG: PAS domain-containing protein [Candidatus Omnitrophica bacterium]|nr:PAS domain-containing protein [Candidatus Omnitrophota bacterium]
MVLILIGASIVVIVLIRRYYADLLRRKGNAFNQLSDQLKEQRQQSFHDKNELNAILSSMVEGVMVIGSDDKILYLSPNALGMFTVRSKDAAHKPYWEIIGHHQINASIKEALEHKSAVNKEITLIGPRDVFFSLQISPVLQDGNLTSVVAVFHDITELKKLIKMRSEFVANVSHELKTPLTSIKGFVETLRDEGNLEDKANAQRFLSIIHKQTQRLEMLVDDLLTLSAIESKEAKMDFGSHAVAPIVQSVLSMYKRAIDAAGHQVEVNVPQDLPAIYADRHRIEQVFINLLDNAVKFTPSPGRIRIEAKPELPFVRIDVQDTGAGIAPEHLSRIFERFYRVDKARSGMSAGTGLGLAIVKHIVQAHQGKIEVQSAPGQGTTFRIFLPMFSK